VDEGNFVTGGAAGFDPQAANEVLPKVYHRFAGWGCQDSYGGYYLGAANWWPGWRHESCGRERQFPHGAPVA